MVCDIGGDLVKFSKAANEQSFLRLPLIYIPFIFIIFCVIGFVSEKNGLKPLYVSVILGLLNCMALFYFGYKVKKVSSRKRTSKHIGNIANYIYETVTQLETEAAILKRGSNEFQKSLKEVTKAIEDIAAGSISVVSDTEKIAKHVEQLEKTVADNYENIIRRVTDNMDRIIENKNRGLKLMSELRYHTQTTLDAIAEIDKMVTETSTNTNKIVEAGETIKQIATQTNLLALNAAIVASTSGQSSAGFIVIADEIRSLSDETNKYVKEIQVYIDALTKSVVRAVNALKKVNSAVEEEIRGVKNMDELLDKIHDSTTSTQNYIVKLNESGEAILGQTKQIKESITSLYAINQECSENTRQSSSYMHSQNPYADSILKLINNLYELAYTLRDKSMEIKMLIDIGFLIDYLNKEGYSNENLAEICRQLNVATAYVADATGYVHYCNEEIGRGINLFEIDKNMEQLLQGADYVATPIKQRVEDGKTYKFLAVYRNNRIYQLGMDLSST